ncbi:MAG: hypothetical protein JWO37_3060 [Acidimicrobiales bacterium]|nr:hypothetical protein [Acidimicrobiales bacterium]
MVSKTFSRRALVVGLTGAIALSAACGGGGKKSAKSSSSIPGASTTTTAPLRFALTGLASSDAKLVNRPVLVVKIENAPDARPQSGLEAADVVYEEVVEGGLTRFLAVFQSRDSDLVGPIRSVRPTDPDIVRPLGGLFAYSGGTKKFIGLLHQAPVRDVGYDEFTSAYDKRSGRRAPHNLYSSTKKLYVKAKESDRNPPDLFHFLPMGTPFGGAAATPASSVNVVLGPLGTASYQYDAATGTWLRSEQGSPHVVEGGVQIAPTNVIIQYVRYVASPGDTDVTGNPVFKAQVVGSGDAWIFSNGKVVKGTWSKPTADALTTYLDASGQPIALVPGQTWVELPPVGAQTTVG